MAVPAAPPAVLGPTLDDLAQAVHEFMHNSGGDAIVAPPLPIQQQVVLAEPGLEGMLGEIMENVNVTSLLSTEGDLLSPSNGVDPPSGDDEPVRSSAAPGPAVVPSGLFESPQVVRPSAAPPVPSASPARRPRPEPDLNTSLASQDRVRQRVDVPMDVSAFDPLRAPVAAPPLPFGARPRGLELVAPPPAPSSAVEFAPMQAAWAGFDPASGRLPCVPAFDIGSDASRGERQVAASSDPTGYRASDASSQLAGAAAGMPSAGSGAGDALARWAAERTVMHRQLNDLRADVAGYTEALGEAAETNQRLSEQLMMAIHNEESCHQRLADAEGASQALKREFDSCRRREGVVNCALRHEIHEHRQQAEHRVHGLEIQFQESSAQAYGHVEALQAQIRSLLSSQGADSAETFAAAAHREQLLRA